MFQHLPVNHVIYSLFASKLVYSVNDKLFTGILGSLLTEGAAQNIVFRLLKATMDEETNDSKHHEDGEG